MTAATVREAVERAMRRLQVAKIDLMQFHWWTFQHPGWLDALHQLAKLQDEGLIAHLGVTNFDTDHLRVAGQGGHSARHQPGLLLASRPRAAEDMTALCRARA